MFGKHVHDVMLRCDFNNYVSVKNENCEAKISIFTGTKMCFDPLVQACCLAQPLNQHHDFKTGWSIHPSTVNNTRMTQFHIFMLRLQHAANLDIDLQEVQIG